MEGNEREEQLKRQQEEMLKNQQNYNTMNTQQPPKKKSKVWIVILIVLVCLLPIILIVGIMLMSVGVLVYNNSVSTINTQMDSIMSAGVSMYNAQYESYVGDNKNRSTVISLVQSIKANNIYDDNQVDVEIELKDGSTYSLDNYNFSQLDVNSKFDISATKNEKGYISLITIEEK